MRPAWLWLIPLAFIMGALVEASMPPTDVTTIERNQP